MSETAGSVPIASQRLSRVTAIAGLTALVLVFGPLIGTREEPAFTAPASAFLAHYQSPDTIAAPLRSFIFTVGLVSFVWFAGALTAMLRQTESEPPWRATVGLASAVLFVALVLFGNEIATTFRSQDVDAQTAMYAFEEGQASFANARVALGSFAFCCGWLMTSAAAPSRWLGWLAMAIGIALVVTRIAWTNSVWLLPYLAFWLWVLALTVALWRSHVPTFADQDQAEHP